MNQTEPDLWALVARYGGFARVPVEAWAAFDKRVARYKAALRRSKHERVKHDGQ
jgi:hypothetical protein